jgi:murein tripeptide amidase MpaA
LAGNECPIITITSNIDSYKTDEEEKHEYKVSAAARRFIRIKKKVPEPHRGKKAIVVTARVHPGESNSSFMMKGFIEFMLSDTREAKLIRKNYIVKIVPMLNIDGVIYGSYRCSLIGADLNRRWLKPSRILHPTIYYTKKMIKVLSESHEVSLFVDMHGHSRQRNVFMYGNCIQSQEIVDIKTNVITKMLPILMSHRLAYFNYGN